MAMKNNTSSVQVAGLTIPVHLVPSFPDGRLAEYDANKREITLSEECMTSKELFKATLVHEVVHCALDLSGANYGMTEKTEEQVVTTVEALVVPAVRAIDAVV